MHKYVNILVISYPTCMYTFYIMQLLNLCWLAPLHVLLSSGKNLANLTVIRKANGKSRELL